jgi:hypothetical protein
MAKHRLYFSNDLTAWRHLIPSLLHVNNSKFNWELCMYPQSYALARLLLDADSFSFVYPGHEKYVADWLAAYGTTIQDESDLIWFGTNSIGIQSYSLPKISAQCNGFLLCLQATFPSTSFRSLLNNREVPPLDRVLLRQHLEKSGKILQSLGFPIPLLPARSAGINF